jgi:hypothetical protein
VPQSSRGGCVDEGAIERFGFLWLKERLSPFVGSFFLLEAGFLLFRKHLAVRKRGTFTLFSSPLSID